MRFLADAGISPKTIQFLSELAHHVVHVRSLGLGEATDAAVIDRARQESRVVLTFDLDFGDIANQVLNGDRGRNVLLAV